MFSLCFLLSCAFCLKSTPGIFDPLILVLTFRTERRRHFKQFLVAIALELFSEPVVFLLKFVDFRLVTLAARLTQ